MSSFRKNRGKQDTAPVEVPRTGATLRNLKEPQPAHPAWVDPGAGDATAVMNLGSGTVSFGGREIGRVRDVQVQIRRSPDLTNDFSGVQAALDRAMVDGFARRIADDMEQSFMHGTDRTAMQASERQSFSYWQQRCNLIEPPNWGTARLGEMEAREIRFPERRGFDFRPMDARPMRNETRTIPGYQGNLAFTASGEGIDPYMAAMAALHNGIVREGLGQTAATLEQRFSIRRWYYAFIFCPDGIPAICGVIEGIAPYPMVVGASFRNQHCYRPTNCDHHESSFEAAVEDFLLRAHGEANPALGNYVGGRTRR